MNRIYTKRSPNQAAGPKAIREARLNHSLGLTPNQHYNSAQSERRVEVESAVVGQSRPLSWFFSSILPYRPFHGKRRFLVQLDFLLCAARIRTW